MRAATKRWLWIALSVFLGVPGFLTATYASREALDYVGLRPILNKEFNELESQVAAVTNWVQVAKWSALEEKRKHQGLTPNERVEYCVLSKLIGFKGEGCA